MSSRAWPSFRNLGIAGRQCITAAQFEPDPHQIGKGQKRRHLQETCFQRACEYAAPNPVERLRRARGPPNMERAAITRFLHEASGTTRCSESDPRSGTTTSDSISRPDASKSDSTRDFAGRPRRFGAGGAFAAHRQGQGLLRAIQRPQKAEGGVISYLNEHRHSIAHLYNIGNGFLERKEYERKEPRPTGGKPWPPCTP